MLVPTSGERLAAEGVSPYGRQKKLASLGFVVVGFGRSCFAGAAVLPRRAEAAAAEIPQVLDGLQLEIRLLLDDAELTDPVIDMNFRITDC